MREIIYRAKRKDNGHWVYGEVHWEGSRLLMTQKGSNKYYIIDPDTVCQYSGVDDVDGKRIFENDIVETFTIQLVYQQIGDYPPPNIEVEEYDVVRSVNIVEFSYGSFNINGFPLQFADMCGVDTEDEDSPDLKIFKDMWEDNTFDIRDRFPNLTWGCFRHPRIIGNVFDNPELIDELPESDVRNFIDK